MSSSQPLQRRVLPKLIACATKASLEDLRNKALYNLNALDAKEIRRRKLPLYECLILELKEAGYNESADYMQDLIYDNVQLINEDDIGIVVDLRKRGDYLEYITDQLQKAEKYREAENKRKECRILLKMAIHFSEKGKGILWLAEKFYLASIAVASQYLLDGGRLKCCCKYHYGKFLLDKFPGADTQEPFVLLTEVRDNSIGKDWPLNESDDGTNVPAETVFCVTALQLHRVLMSQARAIRKSDPAKAERLSRLAERRARDAGETEKTAEAIIDIGICQLMMNNLNNAQKTLERAFKIHKESNNIKGLCECKMHMAAVMQRLGNHEEAAKLLTEMGSMAMENNLRWMLGRALHLLGELHLRRKRPDLGTHHLAEAFSCFMGISWKTSVADPKQEMDAISIGLGAIYKKETVHEVFEEDAEQSRLMTAISAGQENMASYFDLIRQGAQCAVASIQLIEWKLANKHWWTPRAHHNFIPCLCPNHNRTPLDVFYYTMKLQEELLSKEHNEMSQSEAEFSSSNMKII